MGIIWKLMANPQLVAVVRFLWAWIVSEVGKATLAYGAEAIVLIRQAQGLEHPDGTPFSGIQKRTWVTDRLLEQAKIDGKNFLKSQLDTVTQTAFAKWQAEGAK